jgi:hypothetical protein
MGPRYAGKIVQRVVRQRLVQNDRRAHRCTGQQERVAVGLGPRYGCRTYNAAAWTVLDNKRLAYVVPGLIKHQARDDVVGGPGTERTDYQDRTFRPLPGGTRNKLMLVPKCGAATMAAVDGRDKATPCAEGQRRMLTRWTSRRP